MDNILTSEALRQDSYGYDILEIETLEDIQQGANHYVFRDVHFLMKKRGKSNLIVGFHGSLVEPEPVFRCHNYEGVDVLSISDRLINKYGGPRDKPNKIAVSWYLNSQKYPDNMDIYGDIIGHVIDSGSYEKVLFFGTSAGGYPSLYYAGLFNKECLISNAQIYLPESGYYSILTTCLEKHSDKLLEEPSICDHFLEKGFPARIHIHCNNEDVIHYRKHFLPFLCFCSDSGYTNTTVNIFTVRIEGINPHGVLFYMSGGVGAAKRAMGIEIQDRPGIDNDMVRL